MDYYSTICSVVIFVESRIQEKIDYKELEKATGFSLAHLRDIFVKKTGMSLSRYILSRKVANSAYEILHNHQSILAIATKYGFSNADTFTRAFRRFTGLTPSDFRKKRWAVGRIKLCAGVYGVGFLDPVRREDERI